VNATSGKLASFGGRAIYPMGGYTDGLIVLYESQPDGQTT
jgi:hypothetical protein